MGTYGLRVPASRIGYVPDAQGGSPPGPHVLYVRGTRTSLGRWVRTGYCGNPGRESLFRYLEEQAAREAAWARGEAPAGAATCDLPSYLG